MKIRYITKGTRAKWTCLLFEWSFMRDSSTDSKVGATYYSIIDCSTWKLMLDSFYFERLLWKILSTVPKDILHNQYQRKALLSSLLHLNTSHSKNSSTDSNFRPTVYNVCTNGTIEKYCLIAFIWIGHTLEFHPRSRNVEPPEPLYVSECLTPGSKVSNVTHLLLIYWAKTMKVFVKNISNLSYCNV